MAQQTALIVGAPSRIADDLRTVLTDDGILVGLLAPAALGIDPLPTGDDPPDVVLVSAALTVEEVTAVADALRDRGGPTPAMLAFSDSSVADLERHVRTGLDYIVPPFRPALVRSRLLACQAHEQLTETVRQIQDAAHLAKYERELQIGREIQSGFLPDSIPQPPGWEIEVRFRPAREVAGDFYDAFTLVNGRRIGFVVADVCDKGVGAALFMALIRSLLRHTASQSGSLSLIGMEVEWEELNSAADHLHRPMTTSAGVGPLLNAVAGTNDYMTQNHLAQGYFATLFFGVLDPATGAVVYINCGHNPPVLRRADGEQVTLEPTGPALGMLPGSTFKLGRTHLGHGDLLYLYTDGVTEAKDAGGDFFTEPRMRRVVEDDLGAGAGSLLERFESELHDHVGAADQFDDITMMALYRRPDPSSAIGAEATDPQRPTP